MTGPMRILFVHNRYQQAGGEDSVVRAEMSLLRSKGHLVEILDGDNDSIVGWISSARTAVRCTYSFSASHKMQARIREINPDVVHIHNFFPQLSPSIHYACYSAGVPVVQTLHNYRLLCPASTLLRDGKICEECVGKVFQWPSVHYGCYRGSRLASAAVANMSAIHRLTGTWNRTVTRFIALTNFARNKFVEGGFPADKIIVKPNFVDQDPGMGTGSGGFALYVGRLSEEKGLDVLLAAWNQLRPPLMLKIVGEGPLAPNVQRAISQTPGIQWIGWQSKKIVYEMMSQAAFLVFPSICYETFGLAVIEAFASGLPVIASRIGAIPELISDGITGRLVEPGNVDELASAIRWAHTNPHSLSLMRCRAREAFEERYTSDINYLQMERVYSEAIHSNGVTA